MKRETSKIIAFVSMCTALILSSTTNSKILMWIYLAFAILDFAYYIYLDRKSN